MSNQPIPHGVRTRSFEEMPASVQRYEKERLEDELQQERQWIRESGLEPHQDIAGILGSIASGVVVKVPTGRHLPIRQYYQDRYGFENVAKLPEDACSVPYLRSKAVMAMMHVASTARRRLMNSEDGQDYLWEYDITNIQYSVTSMLRSRIYQKLLINKNSLALDGDSAHLFGIAFDVDHSGYYVQTSEGSTVAVNGLRNADLYHDSPIRAFQQSLEESATRGDIAFVTELPTGRGCWHVSANPM